MNTKEDFWPNSHFVFLISGVPSACALHIYILPLLWSVLYSGFTDYSNLPQPIALEMLFFLHPPSCRWHLWNVWEASADCFFLYPSLLPPCTAINCRCVWRGIMVGYFFHRMPRQITADGGGNALLKNRGNILFLRGAKNSRLSRRLFNQTFLWSSWLNGGCNSTRHSSSSISFTILHIIRYSIEDS